MTAQPAHGSTAVAAPPQDRLSSDRPPREHPLGGKVAARLRALRDWRRDVGKPASGPRSELLDFARRQLAAQGRVGPIELAEPLSLSVDASDGSVRLELARVGAFAEPAEELLARVAEGVAPALFASGLINRVEIGLIRAGEGGSTSTWAIVHPGDAIEGVR